MKLPLSWLKEYLNVSLSPEKLADTLTMSGTKVERVVHKNGEVVFEIEITTNRPDCLSILGLAKEASVLTHQKVRMPKISKTALRASKNPELHILDKKGCPLYTARLIKNVSIKPAPQKIQTFLDLTGTRAINNVVDATNFVLFETGQPLHVFDYDKIKGGMITVRRARKNEKFLGIDGVEYPLDEATLVIADTERPIAIAGVIGGKFTEVTGATKNILLESAYFDPALVRRASRAMKVSTDSSYRFERGVDRENVVSASTRAKDLILEWAGGSETEANFSETKEKKKPAKISLRIDRVEKLLGMSIKPNRVTSILTSLGLKTQASGKGKWTVLAPSFRRDLTREEDLIEEVLRIEGFEKVPAVVPVMHPSTESIRTHKASRLLELRKFISTLGFHEIITYSFLSEKALRDSSLTVDGPKKPHKLTNALSGELQYFRSSLLPGMLQSAVFNIHRKASSFKLFEIGNRYLNGAEETVLSMCLYGHFEENWQRKSESSLFDLKGVVERVLADLGCETGQWRENEPCLKYAASTSLYLGEKKLGTLGMLSAQVLKNWDIPRDVIYAEIVLDALLERTDDRGGRKVRSIPKFPAVRRDVAFVSDKNIPVKIIEEVILKAGGPFLKEVALFDQFVGKNIAEGKRSLAFSLCYQKETGTFTDEEINSLHAKVGEALKSGFRVEFR